jgi:hypothetical protein
MTQTTDTDSRELKDLIQGLDRKIDGLDRKIELGFANVDLKLAEIKGDIKALDTRVVEVEKKIDKQDTRLWTFGGIVLSAALGVAIKLLTFPDH